MRIRRNGRGVYGLIVGVAALLLGSAPARAANTSEEQVMDAIPDGSTVQITKDNRFIFVTEPAANNKKILAINGAESQPYDDIRPPVYQSNALKDRMVYAAKDNNQWFYVDRGAALNPFDDVGPAYLSPDTGFLFYSALVQGSWCPILNGQVGQPCDAIGQPTFSADSKHVAYPIANGNQCNLIADAIADIPCDWIGAVVYSPNSQHLAYDLMVKNQHFIRLDGVNGPAFDEILPGTPFFTTDNVQCVYCGKINGVWNYVVNGAPQPMPGVQNILSVPIYKIDNKHHMFVADVGNGKKAIVYDGAVGIPYDDIATDSLHFQPDVNNTAGPQYIYQATQVPDAQPGQPAPAPQQMAILDRFPGPGFETVVPSTVNFTPDGAHSFYWAHDQGQWLWRNDRHTVDHYDDYKVGATPYAADSKRTMYAAKTPATNGKWQVFIDGNALPNVYDDIDETEMMFTPDAKHTIFVGKSNGAWKVVIDGTEGPDYASIQPGGGPSLQPDGTLIYFAIKANGSLNRIKYSN